MIPCATTSAARVLLGLVVAALAAAGPEGCAPREEPLMTDTRHESPARHETASFAAGCFWGVEAAFRQTEGVVDTAVGYTGGWMPHPTYEDVCTGRTGHAETVQVTYDPQRVSYEELLEVFWKSHDPTQVNRQGPDVGDQYRSAIFYHTPEQKQQAEASRQRQQARHRKPLATKIEPAGDFWRAEEYHQRYLEKRGRAACHPGLR